MSQCKCEKNANFIIFIIHFDRISNPGVFLPDSDL